MLRTHNCGELRREDEGKKVSLCGFVDNVRSLGSLVFIDLRDFYGITQLNVDPELYKKLSLSHEDCIRATGVVSVRKEANTKIATGEIEIIVDDIVVYSRSKELPFPIRDSVTCSEDLRLRYRYLDLRRKPMRDSLFIRSEISRHARDFLAQEGFVEVDTPTLIKSTPEGARDFLVPSRNFPGSFYALPQSPQIYKQLLMVSGVDRYFQLAHCYRDEDQRADRQPEFMQIDCEMAFVEREDVLDIIERLLKYIFLKVKNVVLPDFQRVSYKQCITMYGTDKPDMRYELFINDVTDVLENSGMKAYEGKKIHALVIPGAASSTTRKNMDEDNELAKKYGAYGVGHLKYNDNVVSGSTSKFLYEESKKELAERLELKEDDLVILCADTNYEKACKALGALRIHYAEKLSLIDKNAYKPLFVIDWPMFERDEEGNLVSLSNPFTRPVDEDLPLLDSDPVQVRTTSYDTVLNGVELSSGALRIHSQEVQKKVFELLGLTDEDINGRFGFLVEALGYSVPPEGGFGIGIERLAMEIIGTDNVRDVVAFPKNLKGIEPMSSCPSEVDEKDLKVLGIGVIKNG